MERTDEHVLTTMSQYCELLEKKKKRGHLVGESLQNQDFLCKWNLLWKMETVCFSFTLEVVDHGKKPQHKSFTFTKLETFMRNYPFILK